MRLKYNLEKKISEFFPHRRRIFMIQRVQQLVCLFQKILLQILQGLRAVPRATALRAKSEHHVHQGFKSLGDGLCMRVLLYFFMHDFLRALQVNLNAL